MNLHLAARLVAERCVEADTLEAISRVSMRAPVDDEIGDEEVCLAAY